MNCYGVHEHEMESLSNISLGATFCFSLSAALLGYAAAILNSAVFADHITPAGLVATKTVAPWFIFVAIALGLAGGWQMLRRQRIWNRIKRESVKVLTTAG